MSFEDRERAIENKFGLDQQQAFQVEARACKLLGIWAAGKMGMTGDDALTYAKSVVIANLDEPGYDDVKRKIMTDLSGAGFAVTEIEIDHAIEKCAVTAADQIQRENGR